MKNAKKKKITARNGIFLGQPCILQIGLDPVLGFGAMGLPPCILVSAPSYPKIKLTVTAAYEVEKSPLGLNMGRGIGLRFDERLYGQLYF